MNPDAQTPLSFRGAAARSTRLKMFEVTFTIVVAVTLLTSVFLFAALGLLHLPKLMMALGFDDSAVNPQIMQVIYLVLGVAGGMAVGWGWLGQVFLPLHRWVMRRAAETPGRTRL